MNANTIPEGTFALVSCDDTPNAYPGYLTPSNVLDIALAPGPATVKSTPVAVILYSEVSGHCNLSMQGDTSVYVFTITNPAIAVSLAKEKPGPNSPGNAAVLPDLASYTNTSSPDYFGGGSNNVLGPSPTTAVAMIILYSITGVITVLFVVIIFTGAIRAHRHPERYGPRPRGDGRNGQSRAKGIARAMLETLPIIKFGDDEQSAAKTAGNDVEMTSTDASKTSENQPDAAGDQAPKPNPALSSKEIQSSLLNHSDHIGSTPHAQLTTSADRPSTVTPPAATTIKPAITTSPSPVKNDAPSCSICTEDFSRGEDIRVLPCNHKFHPDCVDPWLLNVSGTCPLCRIDLRPEEAAGGTEGGSEGAGVDLPPPLTGEEQRQASLASPVGSAFGPEGRDAIPGLVHMRRSSVARLSREDRIAALRRIRMENRIQNSSAADVEQDRETRQSIATRLKERFRVGTARVESSAPSTGADPSSSDSGNAAANADSRTGSATVVATPARPSHSIAASTHRATAGVGELRPLREVYRLAFGQRNRDQGSSG